MSEALGYSIKGIICDDAKGFYSTERERSVENDVHNARRRNLSYLFEAK